MVPGLRFALSDLSSRVALSAPATRPWLRAASVCGRPGATSTFKADRLPCRRRAAALPSVPLPPSMTSVQVQKTKDMLCQGMR